MFARRLVLLFDHQPNKRLGQRLPDFLEKFGERRDQQENQEKVSWTPQESLVIDFHSPESRRIRLPSNWFRGWNRMFENASAICKGSQIEEKTGWFVDFMRFSMLFDNIMTKIMI